MKSAWVAARAMNMGGDRRTHTACADAMPRGRKPSPLAVISEPWFQIAAKPRYIRKQWQAPPPQPLVNEQVEIKRESAGELTLPHPLQRAVPQTSGVSLAVLGHIDDCPHDDLARFCFAMSRCEDASSQGIQCGFVGLDYAGGRFRIEWEISVRRHFGCMQRKPKLSIPARSAHNSTFVFSSSHSILFSPPTANTGSITASAITHTTRMSSSSLTDHNQISTQASMTIRPASATPNQTKPSSSEEIIGTRLTRIRFEDD